MDTTTPATTYRPMPMPADFCTEAEIALHREWMALPGTTRMEAELVELKRQLRAKHAEIRKAKAATSRAADRFIATPGGARWWKAWLAASRENCLCRTAHAGETPAPRQPAAA
ncbi:hypothetical protein [Geminisphaera colitermitum]|uniref:hypothetical protein n=1 Tax=Geminisphaera colitermitum TaxID=1148786 RepID=UPI0012FF0695|nr:hypothetical protein [Geminisphaera colitermitum]